MPNISLCTRKGLWNGSDQLESRERVREFRVTCLWARARSVGPALICRGRGFESLPFDASLSKKSISYVAVNFANWQINWQIGGRVGTGGRAGSGGYRLGRYERNSQEVAGGR